MGWVVTATPLPLFPRETPGIIVYEDGWIPGPVWTGAENLAPTGIRSPDRPARSESLYRLSYPGPLPVIKTELNSSQFKFRRSIRNKKNALCKNHVCLSLCLWPSVTEDNVCRILSKLGAGVLCKNFKASVSFVKISSETAVLYFGEERIPSRRVSPYFITTRVEFVIGILHVMHPSKCELCEDCNVKAIIYLRIFLCS
jgi:hypothetical protein